MTAFDIEQRMRPGVPEPIVSSPPTDRVCRAERVTGSDLCKYRSGTKRGAFCVVSFCIVPRRKKPPSRIGCRSVR